jgi:hypothetical protein
MAKKNVGRLAGLAALAGAAYMMSRGKDKDATGPSATADEEKSSKARTAAQKDAVSGNRAAKDESFKPTNESAYASRSNMTPMRGVGDATNGMDSPKPKVEAQVDKEAKGNADAKTTSVVPGGAKKRTEGNEPMPSLKAVEARVASNRTDALRNASRKTAASNTPKSKTPAAPASAPAASKTPDAPKSAATTDKFKHEMPIAKFFKGIREAGNRGNPDAKMASGGMTASRRGDGIAQRGKTRGKMC